MASSKKLPKSSPVAKKNADLLNHLKLFLKAFFRHHHLAQPTLLIAYSGGLDSTVLLHTFQQLQHQIPFRLKAMHVHHGLSEHADDWADFCDKTCANFGVSIDVLKVHIDPRSGLGVEATARQARYEALFSAPVDFVCLGHHQDDQAETLLLQLARGAGVKGLAGMAQVDMERRLLRPLLDISRADLISYARQHELQWIDDESNQDVQLDRNFIRHVVIPTFQTRYKSVTKTLARSAMHMADASAMLDELAELDAVLAINAEQPYGRLNLTALNSLSLVRQANLVRWWLASNQIHMPSAALCQQILQQLHCERSDAAVKVKVDNKLYMMRYKKSAYLVPEYEKLPVMNLLWQGEECIILPNSSRLLFTKSIGKGFAYQRGGCDIKLRIKNREGGEYFKPELTRPRRSLKHLMQTSDIPPWQREQLPLIFMDEVLVIIPNIGVDAHLKAASHEMGLDVHWQPAALL